MNHIKRFIKKHEEFFILLFEGLFLLFLPIILIKKILEGKEDE